MIRPSSSGIDLEPDEIQFLEEVLATDIRGCLIKFCDPVVEKMKIGHERAQRLPALRLRHKWRKSDVPRLLNIGMPSSALRQLENAKTSRPIGRGVVRPYRSFDEAVRNILFNIGIWGNPNAPANIRRQLYKVWHRFPDLVEAAYRGEQEKVREQVRTGAIELYSRELPSDRALANVAVAAHISEAQARKLCHQSRLDRGVMAPERATCAGELKRHLEEGPPILREHSAELATLFPDFK